MVEDRRLGTGDRAFHLLICGHIRGGDVPPGD